MNYIHPIYITKPTTDKKLKYTKYRNLLNNLLRAAKKSHITSRIKSNKLMKETWKTLNNLLVRNKQSKLPDFFKDNRGNRITDSIDIANNFNILFTNIGTNLADKINNPDDDYISPLNSINRHNSIFLNPTYPDEIIQITNKLKVSNSSGIDNISNKLLINQLSMTSPLFYLIYLINP